jgi:hypothetical protein
MAELPAEPELWLTYQEAAERLGWRLWRLKSRARREGWEVRERNRGGHLVRVPGELLAEPQQSQGNADGTVAAEPDADMLEMTAELRERLGRAEGELAAELRHSQGIAAALSRAEARITELEAHALEVAEVRVAAASAEGKVTALLETLLDLRHGLEHERAERAKLAAELAEARKGWLERVLEALRRR